MTAPIANSSPRLLCIAIELIALIDAGLLLISGHRCRRYVTTIYVINSAVIKLSKLTKARTVSSVARFINLVSAARYIPRSLHWATAVQLSVCKTLHLPVRYIVAWLMERSQGRCLSPMLTK